MIEIVIRFFYQENHKVSGDLSFRDMIFSFRNKDEEEGFWKGLDVVFNTTYDDYEILTYTKN